MLRTLSATRTFAVCAILAMIAWFVLAALLVEDRHAYAERARDLYRTEGGR